MNVTNSCSRPRGKRSAAIYLSIYIMITWILLVLTSTRAISAHQHTHTHAFLAGKVYYARIYTLRRCSFDLAVQIEFPRQFHVESWRNWTADLRVQSQQL